METQQQQPDLSRHIEIRETRSGVQKAYIAGTRIAVQNVYVCHELQGMSPDQIVEAYPHLTLPQVHAALAYYYEHADDIRAQLKADKQYAEGLEAAQGPTRYTKLRDALLGDKDGGNSDSVSS